MILSMMNWMILIMSNLHFSKITKAEMVQSLITKFSPAGENFIIILLKQLSYEEQELLPTYDYYTKDTLLSTPTGYTNNIKLLEIPASTSYVTGSKTLPGTPEIEFDNKTVHLRTNAGNMEVVWTEITADIYGYAIIASKEIDSFPDQYPVIAYEYFGNSNILKGDDFKISWVEGKINNVMKKYLAKWDD